MLISANFATWSGRDTIDRAVESIIDQVDVCRVYYNDYVPEKRNDIIQYVGKGDITDKGKFYGLGKNEIAFLADDDLLYPHNYVEKTLYAMGDYPVVSYHGRNLQGKDLDYYQDHITYHFMMPQPKDVEVQIGGTGVMAINTNKILPDILSYPNQKMADVLMGLECKKKGVPIVCLAHNAKWIGVLTSDNSIYSNMRGSTELSEMVDKLI